MDNMESLLAVPMESRMANLAAASSAAEMIKRLANVFNHFMASLSENEEIGVALASFGVQHTIHVEGVRALGPNLIQISGTESGNRVELVQHTSQLSFLLVRVKPTSPGGVPRRKIGFATE